MLLVNVWFLYGLTQYCIKKEKGSFCVCKPTLPAGTGSTSLDTHINTTQDVLPLSTRIPTVFPLCEAVNRKDSWDRWHWRTFSNWQVLHVIFACGSRVELRLNVLFLSCLLGHVSSEAGSTPLSSCLFPKPPLQRAKSCLKSTMVVGLKSNTSSAGWPHMRLIESKPCISLSSWWKNGALTQLSQ